MGLRKSVIGIGANIVNCVSASAPPVSVKNLTMWHIAWEELEHTAMQFAKKLGDICTFMRGTVHLIVKATRATQIRTQVAQQL
jgi:hypothetical protein